MKRIAAAILIAFSASGAYAETPAAVTTAPAAAQAFDLEQDVTRTMKAFDVPGIAIAVVKDGKVIAARGFGVRKLGEPAKVDGQTLFEIASNSKAFTAAALAMLVDEGKLKWDDPVVKHLPDFQMYDAYVTREMTVRDLLTHRSGLGLGAGDLLWWPTTNFSTDEIIERLRYVKPATSFRSAYAYDNLLYIVAGKIIAQKSGKSWGDTVRERILKPVGMNTTTTSLAENEGNPNASNAHSKINDKIAAVKSMPVNNAVGAVGINTNAEDIAKWMKVLLDGGRVEGAKGADGKELRLWSEAQSREMWTAQTPMKVSIPKPPLAATKANFAAYGLGFQLRDYKGQLVAMHGGALQGFYSRVLLVPESKLGIAILTNAESGGALSALQYRLLDQYMTGSAPTDWIKAIADIEDEAHAKELARLKGASATRVAASKPSLDLSAYEGQYTDPWYGAMNIKRNGKKLVLSFARTPDLTGEMEHFQHDTFIVRWKERNFNADSYVTFALDHDGSIEHVKMKAVSTETDFSYDFHDLLFTPVKPAKAKL
ncbi:serine hydrolase [Massilia sp. Mn16-1_5]|uniref:serine hydrolase n=1 Tax=Massilia sp. Mn16-1_5 TaxID=2079199 RepID=UPI00109EA920|nr:serine hydrolase [Massilia sp. Mn16-1_5]THC41173.1 serine hydrolase [Massilia sp. Mn16-1_5]